jgi:hypothetical protein
MDKKMVRFIDSSCKDLFSILDGGNVVLTYFDGETAIYPCRYIDEHHAEIGHRFFHIREFAELMERSGATYAPEAMVKGDTCATYEIYQIKDIRSTDYCFRSYAKAFSKISRGDYTRMYAGMLAPDTTLEHLYLKHNRDDRPFGDRMRSLSMSDVIVINRDGKTTAYYVDKDGFKKVAKFLYSDQRERQQGKDEGAQTQLVPKKRREPER